jgi:hypothetical protein
MASMPRTAVLDEVEVDPICHIVMRLPDLALQEIREVLIRPVPIPGFAAPLPGTLVVAAKFASAAQLRRQLVLNPEIARLLLRPRQATY